MDVCISTFVCLIKKRLSSFKKADIMLSEKTKTEMAKRGNMTAQTVAEGHSPLVTYRYIDGCSVSFRLCRFKDTVKAGLQWCDIPPTELVATALDRQRWRTLSQSASSALEEERRHQAQSARERRHLAACIPATNANFQCPDCARLCKSRIGLQSHSRTHRKRHR